MTDAGRTLLRRWPIGLTAAAIGVTLGVNSFGISDNLFPIARIDSKACPRANRSNAEADTRRTTEPITAECLVLVYVWSSVMPLSTEGILEVRAAADSTGARLILLPAAALQDFVNGRSLLSRIRHSVAGKDLTRRVQDMIAAGATVHYPALLVFVGGQLHGSGILGYKTRAAYPPLIRQRVAQAVEFSSTRHMHQSESSPTLSSTGRYSDIPVSGNPGGYFKVIPTWGTLSFSDASGVHLVDLKSRTTVRGPGYIDLIPDPNGELFVTPQREHGGLEFYNVADVMRARAEGTSARVLPLFVDHEMRDYYPSIGIIHARYQQGQRVGVYRVMLSWYTGAIFRDYKVTHRGHQPHRVEPAGKPTQVCPGRRVSLPIISPTGQHVAVRDEETATTRIYYLLPNGECRLSIDTKLSTGKVAWHSTGTTIAFAIPRGVVKDGTSILWEDKRSSSELAGVFVYDLRNKDIIRVSGSETVNRLTFPDFVNDSSIIFLTAEDTGLAYFRIAPVPSASLNGH